MMSKSIRLALVLHNHQPIGNFEHVFEQAYEDSYRPFLDVFDRHPSLKFSLHTSGCLMEWLYARHPEYIQRLAALVQQGRIEILGGAFFEPILAMIPPRDRIGQIRSYTQWLESRLGATVRGMWMPERVWEQSFTRDLVAAGIEYTVLDDHHFKNAGLNENQLSGAYLTEDDGQVLTIYPGSERLRYLIPFADPNQTIDYLSRVADEHPDAVMVFGDDGEKFGTWPETKQHVYGHGWLDRFFGALAANGSWLKVTTLSEATEHVAPIGKVYLPDSSYREMTEWALPAEQQVEYERMCRDMQEDPRWPMVRQFVRGGFWRNFRVKYPEANEMYSRMMSVSRRLAQGLNEGLTGDLVEQAQTSLYRSQCNCSYWHGAFGGIYLPHLRNAVYGNLIASEQYLDRAMRSQDQWVEARAEDFNFDGCQEVQLANDRMMALLSPHQGGLMYELDIRSIRHNLLATLARRFESYHRKVLSGSAAADGDVASIHERVVFKQEGLDKRVQYDKHLRKSLIDHFYDDHVTLDTVMAGEAEERGNFVDAPYEARVRRNPDRIQVLLIREGMAHGAPIRLTKAVSLNAGMTAKQGYMATGQPRLNGKAHRLKAGAHHIVKCHRSQHRAQRL